MEKVSLFESVKHINEIGQEYWSARDLSKVLLYTKWDKFFNVIEKAQTACKSSGFKVSDHFPHMEKMIELPKGAKRIIDDFNLTRYACYLIVQNADPKKK